MIFLNDKEVKRVLEKKHEVDGKKLQVKLLIPKPCYKNRLLVTNLNNTTSKDSLLNYLEARSRCEVTDIVYGEKPGIALVTFDNETIPDLDKLRQECRKKPLQGGTVEINTVPIADSIVVQGVGHDTSEETISYYFESKRSGNKDGSEVAVTSNKEDGLCFVKFEDYKVVDSVLSKGKHVIEGSALTVTLYMECLGISRMEDDQSWYKQPEAFTMESLHKDKCKFLHQTKDQNLKKELTACFAEVTWLTDDTATLKCTLTKDTPDAVKKAKAWRKTAEDCLTQYLNQIMVETVTPLSEIWDDVCTKLKTISTTTTEARMFVSDTERKVVLVGYKSEISRLVDEVKSVVSSVEEEYNRKKQEITEMVTSLKPIQMRLLLAVGFQEQMMKDCKDLNIVIKLKQNEMMFKGQVKDITHCKLQMYEKVNSFCAKDESGFSEAQLSFLGQREVKDMIVNKMKSRKLYGVWDTEYKVLSVLSTSDEDALAVIGLIRELVVEHIETLERESTALLKSETWSRLLADIKNSHGNLVHISSDPESKSVTVVAIQSIVHGIKVKIEEYISENSVYSRVVKIPKPVYRFLMMHGESELKRTADRIAQFNGKIEYKEETPQIVIRGCKEGLEQAVKELMGIAKGVIHQKYPMKRAGIGKYIHSEKIKGALAETERSDRCVIELQYNETESVKVEGGPLERSSASTLHSRSTVSGATHFASCVVGPGRRIDVVMGDMTTMEVDVIVNAANNRLDHVGGLARAIADKGGPAIQRESNEYIAKNKNVRAGDVVPTGSGRLPCKMVVHAVGPVWSGGHKGEVQDLKDAVMGSMECADRKGFKSIVLPALSAGIFGYPVDLATKHIVEAINTFYTLESPNSGLTNVYLVDVGRKSVDHFIAALQDVYYDKKVTLTANNPDTESRPQVPIKPKLGNRANRVFAGEPKPKQQGSISIKLVKGEIAKQRSDVIVNSTANHLDLTNGAVSKSILRAGGQSLQSELKKKYPSGIQPGDVAISSGGNLHCQVVYHACLTNWSSPESKWGNGASLLKKLVETCLSLASKNSCISIAFPALGTGNLGYPRDVVAQTMFTTVKDFQQKNRSLRDVSFVVYPGDRETIEAFESCERQAEAGKGFQPLQLPSRQSRTFQMQEEAQEEEMPFMHNSSSSAGDSFKIDLVKGEINKAKADVIVNSTSDNLDLNSGAVAKSLLKTGGDILQTELRTKYPNGIRPGEIAVTSGGKLQCEEVYHICLPSWSNQTQQKFLEDLIKTCLRKASDSDYKSIAFPALGTGNLGYPKDVVARTMYEAMAGYQQRNKSLETVKIVIYHKDTPTIAAFDVYENQRQSGGSLVSPHRSISISRPTVYEESENRDVSPSSVDLYFFSDDKICIDKGIQTLEKKCDREMKTKPLKDKLIKKLTDEQIGGLKRKFDVDLVVDKKLGRIDVTGLSAEVGDVVVEVTTYLRNIEKEEGESERATLLSRSVQWSYFENNIVKDFDKLSNANIEKEFESKSKNCKVKHPMGELKIDFSSMQGTFKGKNETLNIIRRDLFKEASASIFDPPKTWQHMSDDVNFFSCDVANTDAEYTEVSQLFLQTIQVPSAKVVGVMRIQNRSLYQQYTAKKKQLEKQNPQGTQNERRLWHGTSTDAIDSINMHGYNRSYCGKNATVHGQGVYFAVNSRYSASDTYSRPDPQGRKYMYLAKVLSGIYVKGDSSMRTPPQKPGGKGAHDLCDSVVDNINGPSMYVVFNDTQAYPEYLVTFTV